MCPHRGSAFSYGWRHTHYPYQPDDRVASNVFYTWEMFRPLMKGITMYPIPDNVIYDPPCLLRFLKENKITRVLFTPSLLGKFDWFISKFCYAVCGLILIQALVTLNKIQRTFNLTTRT